MSDHIYIDLGAHTGKTTEAWIVTHPEDWVCAFEPNPACLRNPRWAELRKHYRQLLIYGVAAWVEDTELPLYRNSMKLNGQSSTLMEGKTTGDVSYQAPIMVRAIDFSRWLRYEAPSFCSVTIKMDIEGAEYAVLQHMIEQGTIGLVDRLLIEFHADKFDDDRLQQRDWAVREVLQLMGIDLEVAAH